MGDTFKAFVKFISDDPIMLGLCIAIIVLVILFFIVLFIGRKKETEEDTIEENTSELLKTEVNLDALKSTQEYNVSELKNAHQEKAIEIPVTTEIPTEVEVPMVEPQVPLLDSLGETSPKVPTVENNIPNEAVNNYNENFKEDRILYNKEETILKNFTEKEEVQKEDSYQADHAIDFESELKDVLAGANENASSVTLERTNTSNVVQDVPFSSVYVNPNDELPEIKVDDFSKTAIIRHIPKMEEAEAETAVETKEENLDDLDLPKLNSDTTSTVLSSIKGETFNIE